MALVKSMFAIRPINANQTCIKLKPISDWFSDGIEICHPYPTLKLKELPESLEVGRLINKNVLNLNPTDFINRFKCQPKPSPKNLKGQIQPWAIETGIAVLAKMAGPPSHYVMAWLEKMSYKSKE